MNAKAGIQRNTAPAAAVAVLLQPHSLGVGALRDGGCGVDAVDALVECRHLHLAHQVGLVQQDLKGDDKEDKDEED